MYLACYGPPGENCRLGGASQYPGYHFWENDQLDLVDLGEDTSRRARVLVSGGGDGGCQDFLRIACCQPKMRELATALWQVARQAGLEASWQGEVINPLRQAESLAPDRGGNVGRVPTLCGRCLLRSGRCLAPNLAASSGSTRPSTIYNLCTAAKHRMRSTPSIASVCC